MMIRVFRVSLPLWNKLRKNSIYFTAAGLYEEGLSLIEKRRLVKFIADSKSSAQEEEENRRKFLTIVESTSIDQEITVSLIVICFFIYYCLKNGSKKYTVCIW